MVESIRGSAPRGNGQLRGSDVAAAYASSSPAGRLYIDAGTEEDVILNDARAYRETLENAGHDLTYREFRGGHDHACWRGSLADGIAAILGNAGGTPLSPPVAATETAAGGRARKPAP